MKSRWHLSVLLIGCMCLTGLTSAAQQSLTAPGGAPASGAVPNLIKYSSVLKEGSGAVNTALSGVTFLIYKDELRQNIPPNRRWVNGCALFRQMCGSGEPVCRFFPLTRIEPPLWGKSVSRFKGGTPGEFQ